MYLHLLSKRKTEKTALEFILSKKILSDGVRMKILKEHANCGRNIERF